ncbi:MAG: sugar ABC transporter permease [Clostridia bacterium]|nr:sugar ABC transporter permease [Clostridia bacterium]
MKIKTTTRYNLYGYAFMAPFFLLFFLFTIMPVFIALFESFTNYNMLQAFDFVGVNNYKLLFLDDDIFLIALKNTFIFAFITAPICFFLSFFIAWVINQLKCRTVFALFFYAPSIMSSVAISVVWLYFFSGDRYGLINNILINMGLISTPIQWTINSDYIMTVVVLVQIFTGMGTNFLVFLAGLQNISKELSEAGMIDGIGNKWEELRYIIFPQVKPQLLFGAINGIAGAFGVFDIAVSVAGLPSPNYAGHTIVTHLYDYAFIRFQMGYASAIAVVLFVVTFTFGRVVMRVLRSND